MLTQEKLLNKRHSKQHAYKKNPVIFAVDDHYFPTTHKGNGWYAYSCKKFKVIVDGGETAPGHLRKQKKMLAIAFSVWLMLNGASITSFLVSIKW